MVNYGRLVEIRALYGGKKYKTASHSGIYANSRRKLVIYGGRGTTAEISCSIIIAEQKEEKFISITYSKQWCSLLILRMLDAVTMKAHVYSDTGYKYTSNH